MGYMIHKCFNNHFMINISIRWSYSLLHTHICITVSSLYELLRLSLFCFLFFVPVTMNWPWITLAQHSTFQVISFLETLTLEWLLPKINYFWTEKFSWLFKFKKWKKRLCKMVVYFPLLWEKTLSKYKHNK